MAGRIKKLFAIMFVLAALFVSVVFAGCAPTNTGGGDNPPTTPTEPGTPVNPDDPDGDAFTVTLKYVSLEADGNFTDEIYPHVTDLEAQWTEKNTGEIFFAKFDSDGVAKRSGLDGDYKVTLRSLPVDQNGAPSYNYDPNVYEATNDIKDVDITLYKITPLGQRQVYKYELPYYTLPSIGAYSIELTSEKDNILFNYKPQGQGVYTMKTMVDITRNEVDPGLDVYNGILPYYMTEKPFASREDGGAANTFTRNVFWEYSLSTAESGGDNGLIFSLRSRCNPAVAPEKAYPLRVDFILDRDGDFTSVYEDVPEAEVHEDFTKTPATPAGTYTICAERPGVTDNVLSEKAVRLNPEDGYYYYYDSLTETYGDRLYAKLTGGLVSAAGGSWFTGLNDPHIAMYYVNGIDYRKFYSTYCEHLVGGAYYPVNEDIKQFLQNFSLSQRFFNDGNGFAETNGGLNSDEDSQWMFACGYFA